MLKHKIYRIYVSLKKLCHNRLTYNFANRITVYVKSVEQDGSQNTKINCKDLERKKYIF